MLGGIGMQEMLLIFLVILLLFGSKRIPDIANSLGRGVREFKKAMQDTQDEITREISRPIPPDAPQKSEPTDPIRP